MVAGPQLGYFYPEFFWEVDMEGGGVSVRGGSLSGIPNVLIGRGPDYGWSFTSSQSDNIDTFAETLCGDDHHYLYKGVVHGDDALRRRRARTIRSPATRRSRSGRRCTARCTGYGNVGGKRVALAQMRSTRGRELKAALDVYDLSTGRLKSAQQFTHDLSRFEMSFNGFYVDSKHIAYVSSGRLPIRAAGVDPGFPTVGTGAYDWTGFLAPAAHPQAIDPPSGEIVNWNNKPAPGFAAADDNFAYGSIHRSLLLARNLKPREEHGARRREHDEQVGDAGSARGHRLAADQREARADAGAEPARRADARRSSTRGCKGRLAARPERRRQDRRPGRGDPRRGVAEARRRRARAGARHAHRPARGADGPRRRAERQRLRLHRRLVRLRRGPGPARRPVREPLLRRGRRGRLLEGRSGRRSTRPGNELAATQGADPTAWRADATAERIHFAPGILTATMRWTNRPTYQQILSFDGHR